MEDRDHQNLPESWDDYVAVVDEEEGDEDGGGFTFPALPFAADGSIVPVYPIFGRPPSPPSPPAPETATVRLPLGRLLLEERDFRARQRDAERPPPAPPDEEGGELEGVAPESYCLWAPGQSAPASPRVCRKSGSTGSVLRWRSISDRFVGRSHSDGKEKFVFLSAGSGSGPPKQDEKGDSGRKDDGAVSVGDRGRSYYSKGAGGGGGGGGAAGRRRSYLPYKQELVGLFANVSGLRRSYPPF
ncbi:uncharacterized protein LOC124668098 [Lolium rigidum]|uniref:uncharacterized protein LOC124668098 n=1 Tax=Lolium rigidum TaxID=89674 RepID=UPI001F5C3DDB|nr:uncharacterized protein LOC124668098 [Lolium rigidum]